MHINVAFINSNKKNTILSPFILFQSSYSERLMQEKKTSLDNIHLYAKIMNINFNHFLF